MKRVRFLSASEQVYFQKESTPQDITLQSRERISLAHAAFGLTAEQTYAVIKPFKILSFAQTGANVKVDGLYTMQGTINGRVAVRNLAFSKKVTVRWTMDAWNTYKDLECTYAFSEGFNVDMFVFALDPVCESLLDIQFAVCYEVNDQQFWDNNKGQNYQISLIKWTEENEIPVLEYVESDSDHSETIEQPVQPKVPVEAQEPESSMPANFSMYQFSLHPPASVLDTSLPMLMIPSHLHAASEDCCSPTSPESNDLNTVTEMGQDIPTAALTHLPMHYFSYKCAPLYAEVDNANVNPSFLYF